MLRQIKAAKRLVLASLMAAGLGTGAVTVVHAAGGGEELPSIDWSFSGPFGVFDRAQLQRGYKVYKEVCASCHSLDLVTFRTLAEPGGPEFTVDQVKVLAAEYEVEDGPNEDGDMFMRPAISADPFVAPFPNENAARASNNGALPPDLSLIAKARKNGPDYIYAILTGYHEAPAGIELADGMSYNPYFPGQQIAMAQPIDDDFVEYDDDTPATLENYAKDVSAFLMWAAEPKLEARHDLGFRVVIFLLIFCGLLYA
ncbi:MAG: cytochrome c1, partial [Fimbriimonadaceae bacterium]|nr:cytochrome c1 [Alphaproteobacteria bacterium]